MQEHDWVTGVHGNRLRDGSRAGAITTARDGGAAASRIDDFSPAATRRPGAGAHISEAARESVARAKFRERLDAGAAELTRIGDEFRIRHSEVTQAPIQRREQVDYLFHRLFALVELALRMRRRGGPRDASVQASLAVCWP
jgi:hypothetical protein